MESSHENILYILACQHNVETTLITGSIPDGYVTVEIGDSGDLSHFRRTVISIVNRSTAPMFLLLPPFPSADLVYTDSGTYLTLAPVLPLDAFSLQRVDGKLDGIPFEGVIKFDLIVDVVVVAAKSSLLVEQYYRYGYGDPLGFCIAGSIAIEGSSDVQAAFEQMSMQASGHLILSDYGERSVMTTPLGPVVTIGSAVCRRVAPPGMSRHKI